jgi:AcrR family transcriptional regulator
MAEPDKMKAKIIEAAYRLISSFGTKWSMNELCSEAGVAKETLYRKAGRKEDLINEVLEARLSSHEQAIAKILSEEKSFEQVLEMTCGALATLLEEVQSSQWKNVYRDYEGAQAASSRYIEKINDEVERYLLNKQQQGLVKANVNVHIFMKLITYCIQGVLNDEDGNAGFVKSGLAYALDGIRQN